MRTKTCAVSLGLKDLRFVKQVGANLEFYYRDGVIVILKYATRKEAYERYCRSVWFDPIYVSLNQFGLVGVEVKMQEERGES